MRPGEAEGPAACSGRTCSECAPTQGYFLQTRVRVSASGPMSYGAAKELRCEGGTAEIQ
jgi:hypothetical protein